MSSQYIKADEYEYYFKAEPRVLSIYDSLVWVDNHGHTVEGQAGLVMQTLTDEVRRLNRIIHKRGPDAGE